MLDAGSVTREDYNTCNSLTAGGINEREDRL
jgi:hypothetical protein